MPNYGLLAMVVLMARVVIMSMVVLMARVVIMAMVVLMAMVMIHGHGFDATRCSEGSAGHASYRRVMQYSTMPFTDTFRVSASCRFTHASCVTMLFFDLFSRIIAVLQSFFKRVKTFFSASLIFSS